MDRSAIIKYKFHRPIVGQEITYNGGAYGTVSSVDENLCYVRKYKDGESTLFIWCFADGLNTLHEWPTKSQIE